MANLNKTKTLFAFTSPRTIEKIIPEIRLLSDKFSGKEWETSTQTSFFKELFMTEHYEGKAMPSNIPLAARDRITRAPKSLGFVNLTPTIEVTEAGRSLLRGKRIHETITRQLLKFQLPSPYHKLDHNKFRVKPYLELLRLTKDMEYLTKHETAMFFLQLTHIKKYKNITRLILKFREKNKNCKYNRKKFIDDYFSKQIFKIYRDEIVTNKTKTRESKSLNLAHFIRTKKNNMRDYADAFIRYLRATSLVSFDSNYHMVIAPSKKDDVNHILETIPRSPRRFHDESDFRQYLFSSSNVVLLSDSVPAIIQQLENFGVSPSPDDNIDKLKDTLEKKEEDARFESIRKQEQTLRHNYSDCDEIIKTFDAILKRIVPDPSLYLEWNVWRAMTMLNFALMVKANLTFDIDGVPFSNARGNMPDIEAEYEDFKLIIEVTLSTGHTQYNMEGEPVARHFGNAQAKSGKDVYCLFVAPKISEGTLAHFFNLNRMHTRAYGGRTRIVPLNINQFITFVETARDTGFNEQKILHNFLSKSVEIISGVADEEEWASYMAHNVSRWTVI